MSSRHVASLSEVPAERLSAVLDPSERSLIQSHGADKTFVSLHAETADARCSVWWQSVPSLAGKKLGFLGHYKALNAEGGLAVLQAGCDALKEKGCQIAVGPLDGTTWRSYRFITEMGSTPPFFLEPQNPSSYVDHFKAHGFKEYARYFSALTTSFGSVDPAVERAEKRLLEAGIQIRMFDPSAFEAELLHIYSISIESFKDNFLYSAIGFEEFKSSYTKVKSLIDPRFVLLAFDGATPVGFVFAIPDITRPAGETLILKTIAVAKGRRSAGLGNVLAARCQLQAARLGYTRVIHALMHESNNSRNISARYGQPIRTYALFAKEL